MKSLFKNFTAVFLVLLLVVILLSTADLGSEKTESAGLTRLVQEVNNENVKTIEIRGDIILVNLKTEDSKPKEPAKEKNKNRSELSPGR